jgi:ParB/RepB/Spo0J family partition protein
MTAPSFKQMVKDGTIRRADAMKMGLDDIHEEQGFNARAEGPELEASIDALAEYIQGGGAVPPLEVRPRADGGVWVVDGHRRRRAFIKARAAGADIGPIDVRPFVGNDADRVARIVSSNANLPLTPLETASVYKRLAAFNLAAQDIARKVGKTRAHVEQMLILANANTDVHAMVADGTVSAAVAVEVVRKHGEAAGTVLGVEAGKAKAAGKSRVTAGTIAGKSLPRKIVDGLVTTVDDFTSTLSMEAHQVLNSLNLSEPRTVSVDAAALLRLLDASGDVQNAKRKQEQKERDKAALAAQTELPA